MSFPYAIRIEITQQDREVPEKGYAQGAVPPAHTLFRGNPFHGRTVTQDLPKNHY